MDRRLEQLLPEVRWDCDDIRWFLRKFTAKVPPPDSPLMRIIEMSDRLDGSEPSKTIEEIEPRTADHSFHLVASVARLAWSVRTLRDWNAFRSVHESFVSKEILGADNTDPEVERTLPGGIGTITFAARLVQAGGGVVELMGNTSEGLDLKWTSPSGEVILVERKDRSFDASARDTNETRALRLASAARAMHFPEVPNSLRVLLVGFRNFVPKSAQGALDRIYQQTMAREFRDEPSTACLPHLAVAEHLGFELKTGGTKTDFWSPQPVGTACDELDQRFIKLIMDACQGKKSVWPRNKISPRRR